MVLRFRRKNVTEWLGLFILALPFGFGLLLELLHLPALVRYMLDVAWLILLFMMLCNSRGLPHRELKTMAILSGLFFLVGLLGFLFNYQSGLYFLWGLRNNARFFVYFFACILFVRKCSVEYYLRFFDWVFWVNFLVVLYQYFVLGKSGDYLGGIFGVQRGCNGYANIFLSIIAARSALRYMMRQESVWSCAIKCIVMLVISVLAELKAFIIELGVIILMASVITRFSLRKFWIIVGGALGIVVAARGIATLFPDFDNWFNLEHMLEGLIKKEGYTGNYGMNRLTSVPIVWNMFLPNIWQKLFGKGLGNCDYASFGALTSPFYIQYGWLNYTYFCIAMLMLETGLVGTALYVGFFMSVFQAAKKLLRRGGDPLYCRMTQILSVQCLILLVYGNAMRVESAYMMYFAMALPFLRNETKKESNLRLQEGDLQCP